MGKSGLSWQGCSHTANVASTYLERTLAGIVCAIRTRFATTHKTILVLLSLLGTVGVAQAARVQVNVDLRPRLCARFLADLRSDHILQMTPEQVCRYDFLQRHRGKHYQSLDWSPMSGDPVALTMKIYDANMQPGTNPQGLANLAHERAMIMAYAQEEQQHHALSVEVAPVTIAQESNAINPQQNAKLIPIHGYVLLSRGSYCKTKNNTKDLITRNLSGRVFIAFYADKSLLQPIPNLGRNGFTKTYPMKVDGGVVIMGFDTNLVYDHGFGHFRAKASYGADIEWPLYLGEGAIPGFSRVMNPMTACDYTIFAKS